MQPYPLPGKTGKGGKGKGNCHTCGMAGHFWRDCPRNAYGGGKGKGGYQPYPPPRAHNAQPGQIKSLCSLVTVEPPAKKESDLNNSWKLVKGNWKKTVMNQNNDKTINNIEDSAVSTNKYAVLASSEAEMNEQTSQDDPSLDRVRKATTTSASLSWPWRTTPAKPSTNLCRERPAST